jgi:NADP-reducing hydrogenase subunit HndC
MLPGREFKAVQLGGPSGGCLPAELLDTPIDFESLTAYGSMMGSGGMVVTDDSTCMVDFAKYFFTFTAQESCGKCVPCRVGTQRILEILERITGGETWTASNSSPRTSPRARCASSAAAPPIRC